MYFTRIYNSLNGPATSSAMELRGRVSKEQVEKNDDSAAVTHEEL